jgi:type IV pilus assembly protein PilM
VLGPAPNSPEDIEVLIAASRKDKIMDRVAAAEVAGLKATVMDVDVFAAQTAFELIESQFPDKGKDQNIAIVDVGASIMAVNVLRNDQSIYMREQPFGGNQLTQEIQRQFGMSAEEAEAAKRSGGLPDNYDSDVLALTGAGAALALSEMPVEKTVAAVRVGLVDGQFIVNPSFSQRKQSKLVLVVAGT